jgi:hypothetical protein
MELPNHAIISVLAVVGVVILGAVLKAALKELFEDVRQVSRADQSVIRTAQNSAPTSRVTLTQQPQQNRRKSAEKIVVCPDCLLPIELGKLQRHRAKVHETVHRCALCNKYIRPDNIVQHNLKQHGSASSDYLKPRQLPCPRCHNTVLLKNIRKHLFHIHKFGFATSNGRHPFLSAIGFQRETFWIVDGLNIVRMRGQDLPRLDYLLALTYRMLEDNTDFLCVFDASAPPAIRDFQGTVYAKFYDYLIQSHPRRFSQVPAGTIADEFILDIATMFGQNVITNDQYRDHVVRHPWLDTQREQRLFGVELKYSPKLHGEVLFWNGQTIPVPSPHKIRKFFRNYNNLLTERDRKRASSTSYIRRPT